MHAQVERLDHVEGDIDTLQQRLAAIRTWTYAANRPDWLENGETWRKRTREIEDKLSDALHERLMQRFVDRRTSALLRTLNSEEDIPAEVDAAGRVVVSGHDIGRLEGLKFNADVPAAAGQSLEGRALRNAALRALRPVIQQKLRAISEAGDGDFALLHGSAEILFGGAAIARLVRGADWLVPRGELIGAEDALPVLRERASSRVSVWLEDHARTTLAPLFNLRDALSGTGLSGLARGVAFQLAEAGAALDRRGARPGVGPTPALGAPEREALGACGVRTGRVTAWLPALLKPAASRLSLTLRSVYAGLSARDAPSSASFPVARDDWPDVMLGAAGYIRLGPRAVRADMAERLSSALGQARKAAGVSAFAAAPELAALIGCPAAEFPGVLAALGLRPARRDPASGAVLLWRFTSQKTEDRRANEALAEAAASSPFAALAGLGAAPAQPPRRRRPRAAAV